MNKKIGVILVVISVLIGAFGLFQGNEIRRLKQIQQNYEVLTQNFVVLQQSYQQTLGKYQEIKQVLDQRTHNLDSLKKELDSLNLENRSLLDSLNEKINRIIHSIDTAEQNLDFFDWRSAEAP